MQGGRSLRKRPAWPLCFFAAVRSIQEHPRLLLLLPSFSSFSLLVSHTHHPTHHSLPFSLVDWVELFFLLFGFQSFFFLPL